MYPTRRLQLQKISLVILSSVVLVLCVVFFYYPSLHYGFQFDDRANITNFFANRYNTLFGLAFSRTRWIVKWLHVLLYSNFKFNPFYYRLANLIIHSLNGLLIFLILLICLSTLKRENFFKRNSFLISFFTALFFLLHPVQTQTVSYVSQGQYEGLALFSMLLMGLCFLVAMKVSSKSLRYSLIVVLLLLGALSSGTKEITIACPFLIMLLDWFFVAHGDLNLFKRRWFLHCAIFSVVFFFFMYTYELLPFLKRISFAATEPNNSGNVVTADPHEVITKYQFFISQFKVFLHYVWIFVWPFNICFDYNSKLCSHIFDLDCIIPLIVLILLLFLCVRIYMHNKHNLIVFGAAWFFIAMLPRMSIIILPELICDYKTYPASLGIFFIIATVAAWMFLLIQRKVMHQLKPGAIYMSYSFIIFFLALGLGFSSYNRNKVWQSEVTFWQDILKNVPKARSYSNYGAALALIEKKYDEALDYFKKAIELDEKYARPYINMAFIYIQLGNIDEAIKAAQKGLEFSPHEHDGYNNLATALFLKRQYSQAEDAVQKALALQTWSGTSNMILGSIYKALGKYEEALESFRKACIYTDFEDERFFYMYAETAMAVGYYDEAIDLYKRLKHLNPKESDIDYHLADTYVMADHLLNAIELYENLVKKNPKDFRIVFKLGEAYFKNQNIKEALSCFLKIRPYMNVLPSLDSRIAECTHKLLAISLKQNKC